MTYQKTSLKSLLSLARKTTKPRTNTSNNGFNDMPHFDAFNQPILPDAEVVYSPLNRRGIPFIKVRVVGETPKKVRIERISSPGYVQIVEPKRLMVI